MTNEQNTTNRAAYQGETLLTASTRTSTDTWTSGLNNNVLVLGCSGSGKTRNHLKPNLLQCQGSYIVLDTKGTLYREVGPFLQTHGYQVDQLDFTTMGGTIGYNPLDHIAREGDTYRAQDVMTIANAICPVEDHADDPFWEMAAASYLASYIAYVLEKMPRENQTLAAVVYLYERICRGQGNALFQKLASKDPYSYAVQLYERARVTQRADKTNSSIMAILSANLFPLSFPAALRCSTELNRIDFATFGHERRALFVRIDDLDRSMDRLTSLFVQQAFNVLCKEADEHCVGGRLPVPVHFMLDDFANLRLPDIDNVLSVIRSREISATIICQTVSQLEASYGEHKANSIIGNCDKQLVLGFQDLRTADYFAVRANRPANTLLETAAGRWWVFLRGQRGRCEAAYQLENHPHYPALERIERLVTRQIEEGWYEPDWMGDILESQPEDAPFAA